MPGCSRQATRTAGCIKLACDLPLVTVPQHMLWDITSRMQQAGKPGVIDAAHQKQKPEKRC